MLYLLFQLGEDRYALDIHQIVEVLPVVQITPIPNLPAAVAGVFNFRGAPVPAIDLSQLMLQRPALKRFNTRLVVVHYPDEGGASRLLGLVAERATETVRRDPGDFAASGVDVQTARALGPLAIDSRGFIQRAEMQNLLPASVRDLLFRTPPPVST